VLRSLPVYLKGRTKDQITSGEEDEKQKQRQSLPQAREPGNPFAELFVRTFAHQIFPFVYIPGEKYSLKILGN
jgi:hypothetical protein